MARSAVVSLVAFVGLGILSPAVSEAASPRKVQPKRSVRKRVRRKRCLNLVGINRHLGLRVIPKSVKVIRNTLLFKARVIDPSALGRRGVKQLRSGEAVLVSIRGGGIRVKTLGRKRSRVGSVAPRFRKTVLARIIVPSFRRARPGIINPDSMKPAGKVGALDPDGI